RGKERKEVALLKAAEQIVRGETPDGMASYGKIEDALLRRIGDAEVHERELKWIVESMFPVNLWRDVKAEDLVALMVYTGALIPKGKIYVKFNETDGKKYLDELEKELIKYSNIEISINSKIFGEIKISRAIDVATMPTQFKDRAEYALRVIELHRALMDARTRADAAKRELEEELRAKRALVAELEKIAGQLPQRARFLRLDESVAAREAEIAKLVGEIKEVWGSLRPLAKELSKRLAVEEDLEALLNLPEPWLGDYLATLKVYSAELRKEYEEHRRRLKLRENLMAWAKSRLGIADGVEEALEKLAGDLGVPRGLLYAVASRGPGAILEPEQLAAELSADPAVVVKGLEALASRGLITKKYVA
ncbi:MAG: ATPase, partial [Thermoproteus sp.]|nr:ATPase [Thermoproteus sp.]